MNKEQELANLELMLSKGMISQKMYEAQRQVLLKGPKVIEKNGEPMKMVPLLPLSLLTSLRFSFRPLTFFISFVFLFVTVIGIFLLYGLLFASEDLMLKLLMMNTEILAIGAVVLSLICTFIWVLWQSVWQTFFTRVALDELGQPLEPFSLKKFLLKSLAYVGGWAVWNVLLWLIILICLFFLQKLPELETLEKQQLITIIVAFIVGLVVLITGALYLFVPIFISLVGPFKTLGTSFVRTIKKPRLVFLCLGGMILNILISIVLAVGIIVALNDIFHLLVNNLLACSSTQSFFSVLFFGVVVCLGYMVAPKKGKVAIKLSFLFLIPSFILLCLIPIPLRFFPAKVLIAYFPIMQFIWLFCYCVVFFTIQMLAFMSHLSAQSWCHIMEKQRMVPQSFSKHSNDMEPQNNPAPQNDTQHTEYAPPSVFR